MSMTSTKQGRFEPVAKNIAFGGVEACAKRGAMPCAPLAAGRFAALFLLAIALLAAAPARAADILNWETKRDRVSADIKSGKLMPLLEQIASVTGWQVFVEPDTVGTISAKLDRKSTRLNS